MSQEYVVKYRLDIDSSGATNSVRSISESMQALERAVSRFGAIERSIGKVNKALAALNNNKCSVSVSTDNAVRSVDSLLRSLHELNKKSTLVLDFRTSDAKSDLRLIYAAVDELRAKCHNIPLKINASDAKNVRFSDIERANEQAAKLSAKFGSLFKRIGQLSDKIKHINSTSLRPNVKTREAISSISKLLKEMNKLQRIDVKATANVDKAIGSLDRLVAKINSIKELSPIVIQTTAAGASSAVPTPAQLSGGNRRSGGSGGNRGGGGNSSNQFVSTNKGMTSSFIRGMGFTYGSTMLFQGLTDAIKEATDYDNITQSTKNILKTNDKEGNFDARFDNLERVLREVGVQTKFTAPEVAGAGKFLAMAGFDINTIQNSINPIANLALIGDTDIAETADIVTNIMTAYEMGGGQMNRAADILTMTMTNTNTDILKLAESFKYAGTMAHMSGMSFETASAALGVMGNAGIQASHAGTTLRMMLTNMLKPTAKAKEAWDALGVQIKDKNGNLRNFVDILSDLNKAGKGLSDGTFQTLLSHMFRVTAAPGALALIRNVDMVKNVESKNKYESFGLSDDLAEEKKNTVQGKWKQVTSAFTETGIKQFEALQGNIMVFLDKLIELMRSREFANALNAGLRIVMGIAEGLTQVLSAFSSIADIFSSLLKSDILVSVIKWGTVTKIMTSSFFSISRYAKDTYQWIAKAATTRLFASAATEAGASAVAGAAGSAGFSIMGLLSKIRMLFTGPAGWIALAIGAISTFVGYVIYSNHAVSDAIQKNNEWSKSFNKLQVDRMNVNTLEDLAVANLRVNSIKSMKYMDDEISKAEEATNVYRKYWAAKRGETDGYGKDKKTKYLDTLENKEEWEDQISKFDSAMGFFVSPVRKAGFTKSMNASLKNIFGKYAHPVVGENGIVEYVDKETNQTLVHFGRQNRISKQGAIEGLLAQMGSDRNNKNLLEYEKEYIAGLFRSRGVQDRKNTIDSVNKRFLVPVNQMTDWRPESIDDVADASVYDITHSRAYAMANRYQASMIRENAKELYSVLDEIDKGSEVVPKRLQKALFMFAHHSLQQVDEVFGTPQWIAAVHKNLSQYRDGEGNVVNRTAREMSEIIGDTYKLLESYVQTMAPQYKTRFEQLLNPYIWGSLQDYVGNVDPRSYKYDDAGNAILPTANLFRPLSDGGINLYSNANLIDFTQLGKPFNKPSYLPISGTPSGQAAPTPNEVYQLGGIDAFNRMNESQRKKAIADLRANNKPTKDNASMQEYMKKHNLDQTNTGLGNLFGNKNGASDQSQYKSHYSSAAPKQIIVRIENLMRVDKQSIDLSDGRQTAAVNKVKEELATALLDVVQDFNANIM